MNFFQNFIYSGQVATISCILFGINFLACFKNNSLSWIIVFLFYLFFTFILGKITLVGLILALIFFLQVYFFRQSKILLNKYFFGIGIFVWSVLTMLHALPGFNNFHLIINYKITVDAVPYNLFVNFDKPIIGIVLYGFLLHKPSTISEIGRDLFKCKHIIICAIVTILSSAYWLGFVKFELKYPHFFKIWLALNTITVITEEVFFRGWFFNLLYQRFSMYSSIIISSLVFGIFHYRGGVPYILLATIASIFYSYIYVRTNKIENSIILHLMINVIHILFLTYPALA
jgi:membrane protease YdiL (CAAX protease family)